jgi:hypothetical protein
MLHGCRVDSSPSFAAPSVVVREGAGIVVFRGVAPPPAVRELFACIARSVGIDHLPLAWLESAGGRGGFFRGDLVAIGEEDVRRIAASVMAYRGAHARDVYAAVVRVLIAHEMGHAVQAKLGLERFGPRPEQEADLVAGWIAESLGWPAPDDALVMAVAGGPSRWGLGGSHPSSSVRVAAYHEGRALRRRRGSPFIPRS